MKYRQLYQGSTWSGASLCIAEDAFIAGQTEQLKGVQQKAAKLDEERRTAVEHVWLNPLLCALLGYGKGYALMCYSMFCDAMLCYAMRRQGLGGAFAPALDVQAYRYTHGHSYNYGPQP
jgi:hypothetical protein